MVLWLYNFCFSIFGGQSYKKGSFSLKAIVLSKKKNYFGFCTHPDFFLSDFPHSCKSEMYSDPRKHQQQSWRGIKNIFLNNCILVFLINNFTKSKVFTNRLKCKECEFVNIWDARTLHMYSIHALKLEI